MSSTTNPFHPASSSQITTDSSRLADPSPNTAQHESVPALPPRMIQRNDSLGIEEEMPPAYTPSADVYHGESTVEVGPQRPFQQPPRPPHRPSHSLSHSHSGLTSSSSQSQLRLRPRPQSQSQPQPQQPLAPWATSTPSPASGPNSSWSMYPGQRFERRGGGLVGAIFHTVRDVVDAVSSVHDENRVLRPAQTGTYAAPYPQSSSSGMTQSHYAPSHQGGQGQVSSAQQTPQRQIPDDGSPTRTPAPGHPLLNNGNILVYPNKDHICIKCKNTGYKNYDPSHPCRKCWEKYGRPYVGPLTYTPWNAESSSRPSKFQRPLPRFTPPQAPRLSPELSVYASRPSYGPSPVAPAHYGEHLYVCNPMIGMGEYPPVPHAVAVRSGDPRLGGRLCWKCRGTGTLPLLIIDVRPCSECGGIGRILQ
ncbi:hypothetical protein AZE42_06221 [Rhizopogon vesiculosus]|uniref:Uncharacterized protein n=1 Tax=Rhizopogon vesiculosus TaxID=180088 RepID=A0A1J8PXI4_9AGAM|nr:hypothetical protein AZE42_06221 [Rhizopogon vesiculosus]